MSGNREARLQQAADQVGCTLEEYHANLAAGLKHCYTCRTWKPLDDFQKDNSRYDKLKAQCRECCSAQYPGLKPGGRWGSTTSICAPCGKEYPRSELHDGVCKAHRNERLRTRYASDQDYRFDVRQKVHARERNVSPLSKAEADRLLVLFQNACAYCGGPAQTWDHILPVAKGGTTKPGNMAPACKRCNSSKNDQDVFTWAARQGIPLSATFIKEYQP